MVLVYFDKEWKIATEDNKPENAFYLDGELKKRLDYAKSQIKKDNDSTGIIEGSEGSGKSNCAGNIMRYMTDDSFDPKKHMIGADYEEALERIEHIEDGGALFFDEGNAFFMSTDFMKNETKNLHKIFSIFRQKRLFVLICLPSFFRMQTYFALDRTKFLIRTYLSNGERGYFGYYGDKDKYQLYSKGKAFHNVHAFPPTFRGRFSKCDILDNEEYKKFKMDTLKSALVSSKPKTKMKSPAEITRDFEFNCVRRSMDVSAPKIAKILGCSDDKVLQIKQRIKQEGFMKTIKPKEKDEAE